MRRFLRLAMPGLLCACGVPEITETPTYTADIEPMLDTYCVRCHSEPTEMNGGLVLDTYVRASSASLRITCTAITQELVDENPVALEAFYAIDTPCAHWEAFSMPPGATTKLSTYEQHLLLEWTKMGAPE